MLLFTRVIRCNSNNSDRGVNVTRHCSVFIDIDICRNSESTENRPSTSKTARAQRILNSTGTEVLAENGEKRGEEDGGKAT